MPAAPREGASSWPESAHFSTTHWSVVLEAGALQDSRADASLEELCSTYWHPIYCFARRRGQGPEDAQDLTQEFFKRLARAILPPTLTIGRSGNNAFLS
jgi:DNA-directed RNA polymerase specialized sigma24 family protein